MVKLYIQDFGSSQKLFIFADTAQALEYQYNSLYNFGATSGELFGGDEIKGRFVAYIWTNKKKMIGYFANLLHNRYWLKTGRDPEGPLFDGLIIKRAENLFSNIEKGEILPRKSLLANPDECNLGVIKAEK